MKVEYSEHEVTLFNEKRKKWKNFGLNLAYSNSFMETSSKCHVVHWVAQGSPADEVGMRDGDQILQVYKLLKVKLFFIQNFYLKYHTVQTVFYSFF